MSQKKQQSLGNKKAHNSKFWPDLPSQVVSIIKRHQTLEKSINLGGVIKSYRVPKLCKPHSSTLSLPWLHLYNNPDASNSNVYIRLIRYRRPFITSSSYMIRGCSNGILVAEGRELFHVHNLWNATDHVFYILPFWDPEVPFKLAVLSSPPKENYCTVMVLTGITHPAFAFHKMKRWYKMGEEPEWKKQDCTLTEPQYYLGQSERKQQIMQFANAIGFRGKFYALSLQGTLAVIEENDDFSSFDITALSTTRASPSVSSCHFREYLLESDGEILLVYLLSRKASLNIVDDVEVYKLNLSKLSWIKLVFLGNRSVFVGRNCSICVLASEVGCKKNCVYFKNPKDEEWWVYDMESGSISSGWSEGNSIAESSIWIQPTDYEYFEKKKMKNSYC